MASSEQNSDEVQNTLNFKEIFDSSPNPILVVNAAAILECNSAAIKLLGAPLKTDVLAQHPSQLSLEVQPDGSKSSDKTRIMEALAITNGVHRFQWIYKKLDGTPLPVETTLSPMRWDNQQAMLMQWNDLSEMLAGEKTKVIRAVKYENLGSRLGGIAHEINNPLGVISITLETLAKYVSDPVKFSSKLEMLNRSVQKIIGITSTLKKISQIRNPEEYEKHSLVEILKKTQLATEQKTSKHGITLSLEIKSEHEIFCDEIELEQIFISLVTYAVDTIKDQQEKWIKITLEESNNFPLLRFINSGRGIPKEILQKAFTPFITSKDSESNTEWSLTVVKTILERHQASLTLPPDQPNTCFEIRFNQKR